MVYRSIGKENKDPLNQKQPKESFLNDSSNDSLLDLTFNSLDKSLTHHGLSHPSTLFGKKRRHTKREKKPSVVENHLQQLKRRLALCSQQNEALDSSTDKTTDLQTVPELKTTTMESPINCQAARSMSTSRLMVKSAEVTRSSVNVEKVYVGENRCVSGYTYMSRLQNNKTVNNTPLKPLNRLNNFLTTGPVTREDLKESTSVDPVTRQDLRNGKSNACTVDLPPDLAHLDGVISLLEDRKRGFIDTTIEKRSLSNQSICKLFEE